MKKPVAPNTDQIASLRALPFQSVEGSGSSPIVNGRI